ncbi:Boophilin-H2 [Merluccius polli]|uniref:Boophilin-H2 n=1 Tax=Merluccius polli TaxID=89951 RepID=A0AA47N8G4_MERPO|nr:Boophilin-H2 [Merluccius polli]
MREVWGTAGGTDQGHKKSEATLAEMVIFNELCVMKEDAGPCKAIKERFYFDIDTGRCMMFEYGGCGGNANNFQSLQACEQTCVVPVSTGVDDAALALEMLPTATAWCLIFSFLP